MCNVYAHTLLRSSGKKIIIIPNHPSGTYRRSALSFLSLAHNCYWFTYVCTYVRVLYLCTQIPTFDAAHKPSKLNPHTQPLHIVYINTHWNQRTNSSLSLPLSTRWVNSKPNAIGNNFYVNSEILIYVCVMFSSALHIH